MPYNDQRLALMVSWFNVNKMLLTETAARDGISIFFLKWVLSVIVDFVEPEDRALIFSLMSRTAVSSKESHYPYRRLSCKYQLRPDDKSSATSGNSSSLRQHHRRLPVDRAKSMLTEMTVILSITSESSRPQAGRRPDRLRSLNPGQDASNLFTSTSSQLLRPYPSYINLEPANEPLIFSAEFGHKTLVSPITSIKQSHPSHQSSCNSDPKQTPLPERTISLPGQFRSDPEPKLDEKNNRSLLSQPYEPLAALPCPPDTKSP